MKIANVNQANLSLVLGFYRQPLHSSFIPTEQALQSDQQQLALWVRLKALLHFVSLLRRREVATSSAPQNPDFVGEKPTLERTEGNLHESSSSSSDMYSFLYISMHT